MQRPSAVVQGWAASGAARAVPSTESGHSPSEIFRLFTSENLWSCKRDHVCAGTEQFWTVTQDLEAKHGELQSLRATKLEQQGVINRLRLQLGFSGAQHNATAAGKSQGCGQLNCHLPPLS